MKTVKTFEEFVNESYSLNESVGKSIARKYDATLVSDIDPDDLYLSDDALDAFDKALKSNYRNNNKVYTINQNYVRDNGDSWEALIKDVKSKKLKHNIIVDDENDDIIILFENYKSNRKVNEISRSMFPGYDEDEDEGDMIIEEAWDSIAAFFKRARPSSVFPEEFDISGVFKNTVVGVWGEEDDRDYSTINVIVVKTDNTAKIYKELSDDISPMDWSSMLEDMGEEDFEVESFGYKPDSKPKSVKVAAKQAIAFIKKSI